jgi:hypothetical protein
VEPNKENIMLVSLHYYVAEMWCRETGVGKYGSAPSQRKQQTSLLTPSIFISKITSESK